MPMGSPVVASLMRMTPSSSSVQTWSGRGSCQKTVGRIQCSRMMKDERRRTKDEGNVWNN
jgi:hypothetical protein